MTGELVAKLEIPRPESRPAGTATAVFCYGNCFHRREAVAELAHTIAANERWAPRRIFTELLPHAERLRRFASAGEPWADGKLR